MRYVCHCSSRHTIPRIPSSYAAVTSVHQPFLEPSQQWLEHLPRHGWSAAAQNVQPSPGLARTCAHLTRSLAPRVSSRSSCLCCQPLLPTRIPSCTSCKPTFSTCRAHRQAAGFTLVHHLSGCSPRKSGCRQTHSAHNTPRSLISSLEPWATTLPSHSPTLASQDEVLLDAPARPPLLPNDPFPLRSTTCAGRGMLALRILQVLSSTDQPSIESLLVSSRTALPYSPTRGLKACRHCRS